MHIHTAMIDAGVPAFGGGRIELAVDVILPDRLGDKSKLLVCIPGGGACRRYFDMADGKDYSFSFARPMAAAGHVVAMVDPPAVGESSSVEDPFLLTVAAQVPLLARAVEGIRNAKPGGIDISGLTAIGVGHSAGAMLIAALHHHTGLFDALALLCFGTGGLPRHLDARWLEHVEEDRTAAYARLPDHARERFGQPHFRTPLSSPREGAASRALQAALTPTLAPIALQAMTPGNVAEELASIDVPLFTAVGERDMLGPPHQLGSAYVACPDFTQIVVPDVGHHIFLAPDAAAFFARFAAWIEGLSPSVLASRFEPLEFQPRKTGTQP